MAIYQITVTSVTPVTGAESFNGVPGDFFKRCGCPVDTSAEGRSTDRAGRRDLPCREDDRSRRGRSPDRKRYCAPTGREYPQR